MKSTQLLEFLKENEIEFNNDNPEQVWLFIYPHQMEEFSKLFGYLDDDGIICHFKGSYLCFNLIEILEYYGIENEIPFPPYNNYF